MMVIGIFLLTVSSFTGVSASYYFLSGNIGNIPVGSEAPHDMAFASSTITKVVLKNDIKQNQSAATINKMNYLSNELQLMYSQYTENYAADGFLNHTQEKKEFLTFLKNNPFAQSMLNKLSELEGEEAVAKAMSESFQLGLENLTGKLSENPVINVASHSIVVGGVNYTVEAQKVKVSPDSNPSTLVSYFSESKNQIVDPDIMVLIVPVKAWIFTVGYEYYLFVDYHNGNALTMYNQIWDQIATDSIGYGIETGLSGVIIAGILALASAGISIAVAVAIEIVNVVLSVADFSSNINNLVTAFDSTYYLNNGNYFLVGVEQVQFLDGISNSFVYGAWDYSSQTYLEITPPVPEYFDGFSSIVNNLANSYGQNTWIYIYQHVSLPGGY